MRWHKRLLTAGVVGAVAMTASACAGGQVRGASQPPSAPATQPGASASTSAAPAAVNDKAFVYAPNLDVVTDWDPATSYSNENIAMQNIYESLTRYNAASQKPEPRLATEWSSADGGKEWTFKLREGVKFHSGNPVTAEAAKKAIERTMKLKSGAAYIWDAVKKIEAPDGGTLKFTLKYATPLDLVASSGYASYIYDTSVVEKVKDGTTDAGSGPYTIDTWAKARRPSSRSRRSTTTGAAGSRAVQEGGLPCDARADHGVAAAEERRGQLRPAAQPAAVRAGGLHPGGSRRRGRPPSRT
ncbi:ABC transporter substrate-binding protein [Nonomuraea dietziae]|uniref:ABC transporter substrate-binding protein n=1 Tax=Nonomuraea dietziae TaxID=65515 RepID=UPI0031DB8F36